MCACVRGWVCLKCFVRLLVFTWVPENKADSCSCANGWSEVEKILLLCYLYDALQYCLRTHQDCPCKTYNCNPHCTLLLWWRPYCTGKQITDVFQRKNNLISFNRIIKQRTTNFLRLWLGLLKCNVLLVYLLIVEVRKYRFMTLFCSYTYMKTTISQVYILQTCIMIYTLHISWYTHYAKSRSVLTIMN